MGWNNGIGLIMKEDWKDRQFSTLQLGQKDFTQSLGKKKNSIGKNSKKIEYLWKQHLDYPSLPIFSHRLSNIFRNGAGVRSGLRVD